MNDPRRPTLGTRVQGAFQGGTTPSALDVSPSRSADHLPDHPSHHHRIPQTGRRVRVTVGPSVRAPSSWWRRCRNGGKYGFLTSTTHYGGGRHCTIVKRLLPGASLVRDRSSVADKSGANAVELQPRPRDRPSARTDPRRTVRAATLDGTNTHRRPPLPWLWPTVRIVVQKN